ncbi:hypothetical protein MBLNU230_g1336t1 [Neophaeotheca triangularis]
MAMSTIVLTAIASSITGAKIATAYDADTALACDSSSIPWPRIFGAEITGLTAVQVSDYTDWESADDLSEPDSRAISFCNVTISHTHPGWNDNLTTELWLPLSPVWNGRFMGTGGGGWATGSPTARAGPVALGYAAASTDGGRGLYVPGSAEGWSLLSPGNPNWPLIQDFAAVGIDDMTKIGKAVTTSFYGREIKYNYWYGCSTGGRQGLMHAQRFPENYDGILATAPAINWVEIGTAGYWTAHVMQQLGYYPPPCELDYYNQAAIYACDTLDGIEDGIISAPDLCNFNPHSIAGTEITCPSAENPADTTPFTLTPLGATVALATWTGMVNPPNTTTNPSPAPKHEWYGLEPGAFRAFTLCTPPSNPNNCTFIPSGIAEQWIRLYLIQDPASDLSTLSTARFFELLAFARNQWDSIIGTRDPDLSRFKSRKGKLITYHGMADGLIPTAGSADYYQRVRTLDPHVADYYRYYEAPGVAHCVPGEGKSVYPAQAFEELRRWVEEERAPEWLVGTVSEAGEFVDEQRKICQWPQVAVLRDGATRGEVGAWECVDGFGYGGVGQGGSLLGELDNRRTEL